MTDKPCILFACVHNSGRSVASAAPGVTLPPSVFAPALTGT